MGSPTRKVVIRYSLIQIPGIAVAALIVLLLNRWLGMPSWAAVMILLLWIAKDIAMFFVTWRSYDGGGRDAAEAMIGLRGEALGPMAPGGRVCVRGENWAARLADEGVELDAGTAVTVLAVEGLTLVVTPAADQGREAS